MFMIKKKQFFGNNYNNSQIKVILLDLKEQL
jgi:hypothetical protein